jgi:hypothetical protein
MAVIYLKHEVHGAKVAISREEADADEANGWEEFDPSAPKVASQDTTDAPILNALPTRRGRARKQ